MNIINFAWLVAGACFGFACGLGLVASEQRARVRQVRALVAAYETRIAEILGRLR